MKRVWGSFLVLIFILGVLVLPAMAADPSTEIEQLKEEVKRLLRRIEELEKKQVESEIKTEETEKKVAEVEKKAEKAEKKLFKDRINLSGEARFRIVSEIGTNAGVLLILLHLMLLYGTSIMYYDYYLRDKVRFRLGLIDFKYSKHEITEGSNFPILGSSKYQHYWWPYFEVNISF